MKPSKNMALTHLQNGHADDFTDSLTFAKTSSQTLSHAQCELALICEESGVPIVELPILVFLGEIQSSYMMLDHEHMPY